VLIQFHSDGRVPWVIVCDNVHTADTCVSSSSLLIETYPAPFTVSWLRDLCSLVWPMTAMSVLQTLSGGGRWGANGFTVQFLPPFSLFPENVQFFLLDRVGVNSDGSVCIGVSVRGVMVLLLGLV